MALGQTTNPLLQKAEQAIQAKVPANLQSGLSRVVHAGLTIMYAPALKAQMTQRIAQSTNPAQDAGTGAARLIGELFKQSGGKLPSALVMPAAVIFVCEYFDLVGKMGKAQVTPDMLAQAVKIAGQTIMDAAGIKQGDIQQAIAQRGKPPAPAPGIIGAQMQGA